MQVRLILAYNTTHSSTQWGTETSTTHHISGMDCRIAKPLVVSFHWYCYICLIFFFSPSSNQCKSFIRAPSGLACILYCTYKMMGAVLYMYNILSTWTRTVAVCRVLFVRSKKQHDLAAALGLSTSCRCRTGFFLTGCTYILTTVVSLWGVGVIAWLCTVHEEILSIYLYEHTTNSAFSLFDFLYWCWIRCGQHLWYPPTDRCIMPTISNEPGVLTFIG